MGIQGVKVQAKRKGNILKKFPQLLRKRQPFRYIRLLGCPIYKTRKEPLQDILVKTLNIHKERILNSPRQK
jgi:hypothetical protein